MRKVICRIVNINDSEDEFTMVFKCQTRREFLAYHGLSQDSKGRYYCKFANQSSAIRGYVNEEGKFVSTFEEDPLSPLNLRKFLVEQHNFMYKSYVEGILK